MLRSFLLIMTLLISTLSSALLNSSDCQALETNSFSIEVPEGFTTDAETIDNYVSIYGENVTIGIKTESNPELKDVSTYTETTINEIINETIGNVDAKAGGTAKEESHALVSFSDNGYPALKLVLSGDDSETSFYIEEYIITTEEHIFTLVFSANEASFIQTEEVDSIKAGFLAYDHLITHNQPTNESDSDILVIFIVLAGIVLVTGIIAVVLIFRQAKTKTTK